MSIESTQKCSDCLEIKDRSEFRYRKKKHSDECYHQGLCKICERKRAKMAWYENHIDNKRKLRDKSLYRNYSITRQEFDLLLEKQNHSCAICNSTETNGKGTWHVDHDHVTNKVRGLLCHHCNTGLGLFKDNPTILIKAKDYLIGHS